MTNSSTIGLDATTIVLVGGQVVLVIGALVTGILAIVTHMRVKEVVTKQDTMVASTATIEGHVNSEKAASLGREAALDKENRLLREMIAKADTTAGLLAQAQVVRASPPVVLQGSPAVSVQTDPIKEANAVAVKDNTEAVQLNTEAKK